MFRSFSYLMRMPVQRLMPPLNKNGISGQLLSSLNRAPAVNFCSLTIKNTAVADIRALPLYNNSPNGFLQPNLVHKEQSRTLIKYSWKKAKRKTVNAVLRRFYRLNCGNWIRTIAGRTRTVWKKSARRKNRNLKHVFCNGTQCRLLDTMVSKYWRRPTYYIKSIYEPYEWRENFSITRRKPWRPEGCDYE